MRNTLNVKPTQKRWMTTALAATLGLSAAWSHAAPTSQENTVSEAQAVNNRLSSTQQAIIPIAAFAAEGDIKKLNAALEQGLDAGLTVSDAREVLTQVYAYAGFPRSLNALGELMKVLEARKTRGITDAPGVAPSKPIPKGDALLEAGTNNQTKLIGSPVKGPLFDFAPAIDEYLKTHLFGDIFGRDNLDWQSREIATVSMLAVLPGAEAQVESHIRVSKNVGLTADQLSQLADVLSTRVSPEAGKRAREALAQVESQVESAASRR